MLVDVSNLPKHAGPKMEVGERLSVCGKFSINARGEWKPLENGKQVNTELEFKATEPDQVLRGK